MPNLRKMQIALILMGNLVTFVVRFLNNWLVNVAETFRHLKILQTTANKFAKSMLVTFSH